MKNIYWQLKLIINIIVSQSHNLLSIQITRFHKKGNFNADLFLDPFADLYCEDLQTLNWTGYRDRSNLQ